MFLFLGKTVARIWPLLLLGWIALLLICMRAAPPWEQVARHGDNDFLPSDTPSRRGDELLNQAFPDQRRHSSVVLVVHREDDQKLRPEDKQFITEQLKPRLEHLG